jgi:hypothetical protein
MLVLRHRIPRKGFRSQSTKNKESRQRCLWRPGVQNRYLSNGAAAFSSRLDIQHDRGETACRRCHPIKDREAASRDALSLKFRGKASLTADASRSDK